nr:MAG TPA: hypothetical protein [Caudoviricetes sp.]
MIFCNQINKVSQTYVLGTPNTCTGLRAAECAAFFPIKAKIKSQFRYQS